MPQPPVDVRKNELMRKVQGLQARARVARVNRDMKAAQLLDEAVKRTQAELKSLDAPKVRSNYPRRDY